MDNSETDLNTNFFFGKVQETENIFGGAPVNNSGLLTNTIGLTPEGNIGEINEIFNTISRTPRDTSNSQQSDTGSNSNNTMFIVLAIVTIIVIIAVFFIWKYMKSRSYNTSKEMLKNKYIGAVGNVKENFTALNTGGASKVSKFDISTSDSIQSRNSHESS